MQGIVTALAGILLIVFESVALRVLGISVMVPQLCVFLAFRVHDTNFVLRPLVALIGAQPEVQRGLHEVLLFAAVADVCTGGPRGYYALGLTLSFLVASVMSKRSGVLVIVIVTTGCVVLTDCSALIAAALFRSGIGPLSTLVTLTPVIAIWTGLCTLPVALLFDRIDGLALRREQSATGFG